MAKLRYLLLATHVPASGSGGGMVRYCVDLGAALNRRSDVELHVLTAGDGGEFYAGSLPAERIHRIADIPTPARSVLERSGRWLRALPGRFDVVHGPKHLLPRRGGGARRLLTVHDMLPMDRPRDFGLAKRWLLRRPYFASIREADRIVCVSDAARARLLDYVPAVADRVSVVPLAPAEALTSAEPSPVSQLAGRRFAVVVGDDSGRKNLRLAVEIWPAVRAVLPDAVLAIVGGRSWRTAHRGDGWDRLLAEGAVLPLGRVSDAELSWCYANASAVLCPSVLEGFGLPAAEAALFGAPTVTSDDPALCEAAGVGARHVSGRNRDGWVQAVVDAMADPGAARTSAVRRTWDDVAEQTLVALEADHER